MISLTNILLQEDLLGTMTDQYNMKNHTEYEVYKNPKSISRMNDNIRGISDGDGNLYVVDDDEKIIHSQLYKWLQSKSYIKGSHPRIWEEVFEQTLLPWQRVEDTDSFKLGESFPTELTNTPATIDLVSKVRKRNPKYKFIRARIW